MNDIIRVSTGWVLTCHDVITDRNGEGFLYMDVRRVLSHREMVGTCMIRSGFLLHVLLIVDGLA